MIPMNRVKGVERMKCPKCGAELNTGAIFCDQCGNKILEVQDYNESEENISEKLIREAALKQKEAEAHD